MAYNKNSPKVPLLNLAHLTKRGLGVCSYLRDSVKPSEELTAEEKTVQRGRYCWAVAGDVQEDNQEGMLGVWPCVAIQDCGDEGIGVQYTADGKRGTVQRDVLLLHPVPGMAVIARTIDPVSDWHQEGTDNGADDGAFQSTSGDNAAHKGTSSGSGGAEPMNAKGKQKKAPGKMKEKGTGGASADGDSEENDITQDKKKTKTAPKNKTPKRANQPRGLTMGLAGQTALVDRILAGEAEAADQLQDCNVTTIPAVAQQLGAGVKLNQPKEDLLSDLRKNINAGITGPPLFPAPAVKCKFLPGAAEQHPQESKGADVEDGQGDVAPGCVGDHADGDTSELPETGDADGPFKFTVISFGITVVSAISILNKLCFYRHFLRFGIPFPNMSFLGLRSKNKVPTIPPPSLFPIPKGLTYGAAQLLATIKTSWENDYVEFGTYEEGTRMFDSKLFIAHSNICKFLYNRHPFDRDLRGTDFTNAFINIEINKQTQHTYLSPAHELFMHKDEYMPKVAFYLAPPMDKTGLPPMVKTSKHYVELLKSRFASPSIPTRGWFITTSYDREVTSKSYLPTMNGSLVPIKDFIAEIHVFKETKNEFALVRNNTPNFVETNGQSLPVVVLWLDSRKSKTDEIQFFDVNLYEPSLSEAFQHARINKPPNTVNSTVRIDVSIKTLRAFYEESKVLNPKVQGDFSPTDNRIMQTVFN